MAGWRPALRLARRDALRNKGRSILVLVMIALPVLAVSAAEVVYQTSHVNAVESLDRRLGTADARIGVEPGVSRVVQGFDPDESGFSSGFHARNDAGPVTLDDVRRVLGRDVPAVERREGQVRVDTARGVAGVEATELDLGSPLSDGLFRLTGGRWPSGPSEVAINADLAAKGFAVGSDLPLHDGARLRVVGTAESTSSRGYPIAVGAIGSLGIPTTEGQTTWLVGGGPVSWAEVRELNGIGGTVLSRAVIEDPPDESALPAEIRQAEASVADDWIAIVALVVAMALLEVVLLAGPAFAVGARRQQRALALMSASGGTPKQARRVILAGGVVLGGTAAVVGVALGVLIGWALLPVAQHYSDSWLGPFGFNPLHLLLIACFGLLSAFLAAVVPAWIASRQDVVAVLAGRRGDRRPGLRSPVIGVLLLALGIGLSVQGTRGVGGDLTIAGAAVVAVIGMILLVPAVVATLARFSRRLPLVGRYAVRDAARHRTRTVPAVAAVAATVAGVVALGIGNASDAAESEATYAPRLPMGLGTLTVPDPDADWGLLEDAVRREAPATGITPVTAYDAPRVDGFVEVRLRRPGVEAPESFLDSYGSSYGSVLVGEEMLRLAPITDEADVAEARRMLERGGAVVFTSRPVTGERIRIGGAVHPRSGGDSERLGTIELPALFVQVPMGAALAQAVVAPGSLDGTGLTATTAGLLLDAGSMSEREESDLREVVQGISDDASLYVERGYQQANETLIVLAILFSLGAVLMLGGTLTATFLALSDARPDLATLSAVGAPPRTRRGVAAAYALVVGLVGAVVGAAVGFIPGIAISFPLTRQYGSCTYTGSGSPTCEKVPGPSHYLDIPWTLVIGLVVVLPLLTAMIMGLTARSRLPLVARLD